MIRQFERYGWRVSRDALRHVIETGIQGTMSAGMREAVGERAVLAASELARGLAACFLPTEIPRVLRGISALW